MTRDDVEDRLGKLAHRLAGHAETLEVIETRARKHGSILWPIEPVRRALREDADEAAKLADEAGFLRPPEGSE
jgi:hypothetical protein